MEPKLHHKQPMKIAVSRLLVALFLLTSVGLSQAQGFNPFNRHECVGADETPRPTWVSNRFNYTVADRLLGIGSALDADSTRNELLDTATARARANLAEQIRVQISDEVVVSQIAQTQGGQTIVEEELTRLTRQSTQLTLPGLNIIDTWHDPESCELFVMVQLEQTIADLVIQSLIADSFYQRASQSTDESLGVRLSLLESALDVLTEHELGQIPGHATSDQLRREYQALQQELEQTLRRESLREQQMLFDRRLQRATNNALPLQQRLESSVNAREILLEFDLGDAYPNRSTEGLLNEVNQLEQSIRNILSQNRHQVYVVSAQPVPGEIVDELVESMASLIPGTVRGGTCTEADQCLNEVIFSPSQWVTLIHLDFTKRNQGAFVVGHLQLEAELRPVHDTSVVTWSSAELDTALTTPVRTMHRQEHQVTLENAFQRWAQSEFITEAASAINSHSTN